MNFNNKKVLVMGLGLHGGGVGVIKFLANKGAILTVTDLRREQELEPSLKSLAGIKNIKYVLGKHEHKDFNGADYVFKGPGIKPDSEFISEARKNKIPVLNDIALFLAECPAKIVGITGTRGKSTTAFLLYELLKKKNNKVWLAGNIRKSALELLPEIKKEDWVILELSSFQLQDLADSGLYIKGKPDIAIWTNIYPDHLNWHNSMEEYVKAKSYIYAFQNENNYLVINSEDDKLLELTQITESKIVLSEIDKKTEDLIEEKLGNHYLATASLAITTAELIGLTEADILDVLSKFQGLPGRQEKIAEINGVNFINDTTSTMPEATIAALNRFYKLKNKDSKIILIAGGQDKKLNYHSLVQTMLNKADDIILLPGSATNKIDEIFAVNPKMSVKYVNTMAEAVDAAVNLAKSGDWVILSPGAASFGIFLNEFDRGEQFVEAVKKLAKTT